MTTDQYSVAAVQLTRAVSSKVVFETTYMTIPAMSLLTVLQRGNFANLKPKNRLHSFMHLKSAKLALTGGPPSLIVITNQ